MEDIQDIGLFDDQNVGIQSAQCDAQVMMLADKCG